MHISRSKNRLILFNRFKIFSFCFTTTKTQFNFFPLESNTEPFDRRYWSCSLPAMSQHAFCNTFFELNSFKYTVHERPSRLAAGLCKVVSYGTLFFLFCFLHRKSKAEQAVQSHMQTFPTACSQVLNMLSASKVCHFHYCSKEKEVTIWCSSWPFGTFGWDCLIFSSAFLCLQ